MKDVMDIVKVQFLDIQKIVDLCARKAFEKLQRIYYIKRESLNKAHILDWLKQEELSLREKIANYRIEYKVLDAIYEDSINELQNPRSVFKDGFYTSKITDMLCPNYLWETDFYGILDRAQKGEIRKYRQFDIASFNYDTYSKDHTVYDERLPYFSQIIDFDIAIRYYALIQKELPKWERQMEIERVPQPQKLSNLPKPVLENPFQVNFEKEQITLLTECINEVCLFNRPVTNEIVENFFAGSLGHILLRSKNTKLIAYFFLQLNTNNHVTDEWQAAISRYKLILAPHKDEYLNHNDLSSANNTCKEIPPKGYAIIDKYIAKLKKH